MSLNTIAGIEECWHFQEEVPVFTEENKNEAISALQILAKGLTNKDEGAGAASAYLALAVQLKTMSAEDAKGYLSAYLDPESITQTSHIKSFIFLKKMSDESTENTLVLEKKLAENVVLNLLHSMFYKALPCSLGEQCKHVPRKIVHKNDFLDVELDCYFYHHEKDRRRFVLNEGQKEFKYAGNFGDGKRTGDDKSGFSHNFFESLFHPLYYKNFKCVRTKCEKSVYCPYYHSNEEKTIWAVIFRNFIGKDRDVFTKRRGSEEVKIQKPRLAKPMPFGKRVPLGASQIVK